MQVQRKFVIPLLLLAFLFTEACTKKKPPLPPAGQAPTVGTALPPEIKEIEEVEPSPSAKLEPKDDIKPVPKKTNKKPAKTAAATKKSTPPATTAAATPPPAAAAAPPPQQQNNQTVASVHPHNPTGSDSPPAPELAVAAAISSANANKQKEDTAHLLDATEAAIKNLTRQLNDDEKGMRTQVLSYVAQSRKATSDGDFERAYNLAKKAQVLAEALNKP
jgi:hypothetical protein